MERLSLFAVFALTGVFLIGACAAPSGVEPVIPASNASSETDSGDQSPPEPARDYDQYRIVTLLPRDAIPAIDNPQFMTAEEADVQYAPDELVIGVEYEGDARAYSIPFLSSHEIVNDTVGGRKIAVTW